MSFSADIELLAAHGYDVSRLKSPGYAHRKAQALRKALSERPEHKPTVEELRGHTRARIIHETTHHGTREQDSIYAPAKRPLDVPDFANLVKRSAYSKGIDTTLIFQLWITKYPGHTIDTTTPELITLARVLPTTSLTRWLKEHKNGNISDLIDLVQDLFDNIQCTGIEMIGVYKRE